MIRLSNKTFLNILVLLFIAIFLTRPVLAIKDINKPFVNFGIGNINILNDDNFLASSISISNIFSDNWITIRYTSGAHFNLLGAGGKNLL